MRKVVIVYHSISSEQYAGVIGSFPVDVERFERQLSMLEGRGWAFGDLSAIHEAVEQDTVYITHDDGTIDWLQNALPMLDRRGIPSTSFVISGVNYGVFPIAHIVQILLMTDGAALPEIALADEQRAYIDRCYHYESEPRRRYFKGYINLYCTRQRAMQILRPYIPQAIGHLIRRFASIYDYKQFKNNTLGVHTITHSAFDGEDDYFKTEVVFCRQYIRANNFTPSEFMAFPMKPSNGRMLEHTQSQLEAHGFKGAFMGVGDYDGKSFFIPRVDGNRVETYFML